MVGSQRLFIVSICSAPLALPLGELPPQAAERVLHSLYTLSVLASLGHLSQGERQGGLLIQEQAQQMILLCLLTVSCGLLFSRGDFI